MKLSGLLYGVVAAAAFWGGPSVGRAAAPADYLSACKAGPSDACRALAVAHKKLACDAGDGRACVILGSVYRLGFGVTQDTPQANLYFSRATTLLDDACEQGDAPACVTLASMYDGGRGVQTNPSLADKLFKRADTLRGHTQQTAVSEDP